MPVRNESQYVQDTLIQLLAQDYPNECFEIIVADGESDDGTQDIVRKIGSKYPQVVLKNNPKKLSSAGRNIGFKTGHGDIFIVIDGHCYIPSGKLLRNVVHCFLKSGADCLGRPQPLEPPDITDFQRAVALARKSKIGHGENSLIYSDHEGFVSPVSHGAVYKRQVFEKIGYVDESFDACEDVEFNLRVERAGLKTYMSPSIAVKYYPRENYFSLFKQMFRYGIGRFRLLEKHPYSFSLKTIIPTFFMLGFFFLPFLFFINHGLGFFVFSLYALYIFMLIFTSVTISLKEDPIFLRYIGPILFVVHAGLGLGFLKEATIWVITKIRSLNAKHTL